MKSGGPSVTRRAFLAGATAAGAMPAFRGNAFAAPLPRRLVICDGAWPTKLVDRLAEPATFVLVGDRSPFVSRPLARIAPAALRLLPPERLAALLNAGHPLQIDAAPGGPRPTLDADIWRRLAALLAFPSGPESIVIDLASFDGGDRTHSVEAGLASLRAALPAAIQLSVVRPPVAGG